MENLRKASFFFILLMLGRTAKSIDFEGAQETKCLDIKKTVTLSEEFLAAIDGVDLYYPIMSRLDLYTITRDLLPEKEAEEIIEGGMYYDGCIRFNVYPNGNMTSHGFNGRSREYVSEELSTGVSKFEPAVKPGFFSGTVYTTLTDNKTYAVFPFCFDNGQMSWDVLSTLPELSPETMKEIHEHVKSLGFTEEYFTETRYKQCSVAPPPHGPCKKKKKSF